LWVVVRSESLDRLSDIFDLETNDLLLVTGTADAIAVDSDLSGKALVFFGVNLERLLYKVLQDHGAVSANPFLLLLFSH